MTASIGRRWRYAALAVGFALAAPAAAAPLLLIPIDGLRPGDVLDAKARGLAVPNLRRFVDHGAYANGSSAFCRC
ncbi:hypothetical protein [Sphingomonas bacterium]|uniref:hypothetical protein n=1 Tax=Sphingomonas bacterium TaxID=1895847 RepID=UPI0020C6494E|nr:hypothetical protein [Sphingomonas bacterium]